MASTLFTSETQRKEFEEKGYVILPFLDQTGVKALKNLFHSLEESKNDGFFTSMNLEKVPDRFRVDAGIKEVMEAKAKSLLPGYRSLMGNFTIKKPGHSSELRIHLDWSVVDERKHQSIGIWLPLSDVNEKNGALGVMEGSHRIGHSFRGSMVNFVAFEDEISSRPFLETIKKEYSATLLCVPAGHAVVYDLSLAHFSPPNLSEEIRLATNLMMIPEDAQPVHYFREGADIRTLEVDTDFFLSRNMVEPPNLDKYPNFLEKSSPSRRIEEQYGTSVEIGEGEYQVDQRFAVQAAPPAQSGFWQRIKGLFSSK